MAIGEHPAGRQSPFERMLNELDEDEAPLSGQDAAAVAGRLWPQASAGPLGAYPDRGGGAETPYAEVEGDGETALPATKPEQPLPPPPQLKEIQAELAAAKSLDELRRLRRRCARSAHPDIVAPLERPLAEKLMAEVNAAIDHAINRAIKDKRFGR